MTDLDSLDLDIQFLTSCELDQYDLLGDDLANILEAENVKTIRFDESGCEGLVQKCKTEEEMHNSQLVASLLVGDQLVLCPKSFIIESEYLANMAEVFENSEALPVPEIVKVEDIQQIIQFSQILSKNESCDLFMEIKLQNLDLEFRMNLLVVCDLLGFNDIKSYIFRSVKMSVDSNNWKLIYSRCHTIMGLSSILDHLFDFLLHNIATRQQEESIKNWTESASFQFMERILKQDLFEISEEIKFEFAMDWASCNQNSEEDLLSLFSLIHFKCFKDVDMIHQADSDLSQLGFLSSENLAEISPKLKEAIEFKQTLKSVENVRLLNHTKNEHPWPKLLGCASSIPRSQYGSKQLLLSNDHQNFQNTGFNIMEALTIPLSFNCELHYRSSIFYIVYPKTNIPQLCQYNLDFKNRFHVLDLPPDLKSINDRHRNRRNLVMICNVKNYLYVFSKDAFSKMNFDSVDKLKVYRIDLDLAIESCNYNLAVENAMLLKWEHFSDIPEKYLEPGDNNFDYDIKAVDVSEDIFIVSNDLCISLNVQTKVWSEKELAPPARNNPVVFGSDSQLFVIGGTCMGQALVSGQKYNTETWEMELLPNIPHSILPDQDLKHYKGMHFKNFIYLYRCGFDVNAMCNVPSAQVEKPILIFDLFMNQWTYKVLPYYSVFCLDRPIWL